MRRHRRRRMRRVLLLLVLLIAVLAVVFLFQVRKVNVYGNERHTQEEIAEGLIHNLLTKNTLYLQWEYRDGRVPDTMPFLRSLKVKMKSPFEITVEVEEKTPVACVDKGGYAAFDEEGLVLAVTEEQEEGLPLVTGADVGTPAVCQKLPVKSSAQLRTILSVAQLLRYHELSAEEIRFSENGEITVYVDGVEAKLGLDEYLEEKMANLKAILKTLDGTSGTLHLESFTGKNEVNPSFTASNEPETETVPEGSEAGASDGSGGAAGDGTAVGTVDGVSEGGTDGTSDGSGAADGSDASGDANLPDGTGGEAGTPEDSGEDDGNSGTVFPMVFNADGTLVYNVHVSNGVVVDASGNPVSGCSVNANGNVVDAYMNEFDASTGELIQ